MRKHVLLRSQGRVVIPKAIRDKVGAKEGSTLILTTYPTGSEKPTKILMEVIS